MSAYLDSWMDRNPDKCIDFVESITSSRSLGTDQITISVYENRKDGIENGKKVIYLPKAHTCSNSIEMPYCKDQKYFDQKIKMLILSKGTFEIS